MDTSQPFHFDMINFLLARCSVNCLRWRTYLVSDIERDSRPLSSWRLRAFRSCLLLKAIKPSFDCDEPFVRRAVSAITFAIC